MGVLLWNMLIYDNRDHLEIDMHADGYSDNLVECSDCGTLLHLKNEVLETLHTPQYVQQAIA